MKLPLNRFDAPCVITTHNPLHRWLWIAAGPLLLVAIYALASSLDEPAPADPVDIDAIFRAGFEAGLADTRQAAALATTEAYLLGLQDAACVVPPTLAARARP